MTKSGFVIPSEDVEAAIGRGVVRAVGADVEELQELVNRLRERFNSYDGGDRPMSPPARLIQELCDAEARLEAAQERDGGGG